MTFKLLNIIIFPITLLVGLLLMVSGLVPMVSPQISTWLPLFGLAFPIFFVLNVLCLIYWVIQFKWRSLFTLSCLLLNLGQMSLYFQWNDEKKLSPKIEPNIDPESELAEALRPPIKLITYNAQLFGLYNDEHSIDVVNTEYMPTMDSFLRVVKAENPDVLCLQECYSKVGGLIALARFLKAECGFIQAQTYTLSTKRPYGMMVLSKFPIKRWKPIDLGPNTGNMCMWVDIGIDKKSIRIYNLHLQSFRFAKRDYEVMQKQAENQKIDVEGSKGIVTRLRMGYERRSEQVELIKESLLNCETAKIVCGDFNDVPVSYTYRQISAGMMDAFIQAGKGLETTYKGSMPSFRIDYILFDSPMKAVNYHSIQEVPSDHKMVIAELQYNK